MTLTTDIRCVSLTAWQWGCWNIRPQLRQCWCRDYGISVAAFCQNIKDLQRRTCLCRSSSVTEATWLAFRLNATSCPSRFTLHFFRNRNPVSLFERFLPRNELCTEFLHNGIFYRMIYTSPSHNWLNDFIKSIAPLSPTTKILLTLPLISPVVDEC